MKDIKNINTESDFEDRTGLIVWLKSKRNVKRLMKFGVLHYVSTKMNYAVVYVDAEKVDDTLDKLKNERYIKSVEVSQLRDLPADYDEVLAELNSQVEKKKRKEKLETFSNEKYIRQNEW